jgi:hypothetical protein
VKNKSRNNYEPKLPRKFGRLSQLSKANRRASGIIPDGLRQSELDWIAEKRLGAR